MSWARCGNVINLPIVEVHPETHLITELLLPLPFTVGRLEQIEEGIEVELIISHARHSLFRANDDFEQLLKELEEAHQQGITVLVTETDDHEIIDVRPLDASAKAAG